MLRESAFPQGRGELPFRWKTGLWTVTCIYGLCSRAEAWD